MRFIFHRAAIYALSTLLLLGGASILWDGWLNHGSQATYCLPFCAAGPLPDFIAGDLAFLLVILGFVLVVFAKGEVEVEA